VKKMLALSAVTLLVTAQSGFVSVKLTSVVVNPGGLDRAELVPF
jgi:hypothetical protein